MTSPIGSSSIAHTSSLTTLGENRNTKNSSTEGTAGNPFPQQETVHPATPIGPLGHNINTSA
ncbi:hypothetical protein E1N52_35945 [Paraburkholderia guartelaensis]|jgi:hypothetical protein|uniref:Uncharacterized protein n=1 Tax=Paraburkholderia guartelaensis TaxID=2546446 RepID=A0A4V6PIN8_9BURK|nr:hypothetical protein [Paraburkholderia guartelaensis]TDG03148.1 hypothetical protein E1N52_35945 [Paraburkholderia guartelaensis]